MKSFLQFFLMADFFVTWSTYIGLMDNHSVSKNKFVQLVKPSPSWILFSEMFMNFYLKALRSVFKNTVPMARKIKSRNTTDVYTAVKMKSPPRRSLKYCQRAVYVRGGTFSANPRTCIDNLRHKVIKNSFHAFSFTPHFLRVCT